MITLFSNNQACRIDDDPILVGGENCPTSIILVCDLANHALGGLRCPLCFPTRLCIPESDRPDFIVCPTITMGAYNPMPLWPVIACIIIKLAALCSALGEVYWCCGTQFVHPSWPTSRQNAKLYPANLPTLLFSRLWGKFCESVSMALHMYAHNLTTKLA